MCQIDNQVRAYLNTLKHQAKENLKKWFNIDSLELSDFGLINAFLIHQAMNENKNLHIHLPTSQDRYELYVPVILTIALNQYINNFIDNEDVEYEIGDIVYGINDKKRHRVIQIGENIILQSLRENDNGLETTVERNSLRRNYILLNSNTHQRQKFENYKNFFSSILKDERIINDGLLQKFKHKSIIVAEKKIIEKLKSYKINNTKIHKAFPFAYVTNTGNITFNLPIEPMIYFTVNYDTARDILDNENIDHVIFIGANKYRNDIPGISNDLNGEEFKNAIFIGSAEIPEHGIRNLLRWHWTMLEMYLLNYLEN